MITINNNQGEYLFRVAGILRIEDKILFQRNKKGDAWVLPGGRAEVNERTDHVVVREFMEELGFPIQVKRLAAVIENFNAYGIESLHEFGMYYEVELLLGHLPQSDIEFQGIEETVRLTFRWIPIRELKHFLVYPKVLRDLLVPLPSDIKHIVNDDWD